MLICSIVHWHSLSMLLSLSLLLAWFVLLAERHCCHHDPTIQSSHVVLWGSVLLLSKPAESIASTAMLLPYDDGKNLLSLISSIMMKELCQCGSVTSSQQPPHTMQTSSWKWNTLATIYGCLPDKIAAWLPKLIITQPDWSSTWWIKDTKVAIKKCPKKAAASPGTCLKVVAKWQ